MKSVEKIIELVRALQKEKKDNAELFGTNGSYDYAFKSVIESGAYSFLAYLIEQPDEEFEKSYNLFVKNIPLK